MPFLTEPNAQYKDEFLEAVREFHCEGRLLFHDIERISNNFAGFLKQVQDQKVKARIPPDRVPTTEFWLIDGEEYIGYLSLRHELNDFLLKVAGHIGYMIRPSKRCRGYGKEILRLGLEQAQKIGLSKVLVTCDENNIGSKKVIEANGGIFENSVIVEGSPIKKLRYWIDLT
jgi:predicted acetyltransferase